MTARPLIGFGHVWHRRLRPVEHAFRYPGYFLMLPLRSLRTQPDAALRRNRLGWLSFHDSDHGEGGCDALAWFEQLLHSEGIADADGEVWLHTFPRVLGYAFKPVSFWYAHRADGSLAAVLAEVNNTFGERHAYLLAGPDLDWGREQVARKQFHVSPFCEVRGEYRFRFERGEDRTLARVDLHDEDGPLLQTSGGRRAAPARRRHRAPRLLRHAPDVAGRGRRIHWHALRLWAKRVPFHGKPSEPKRFVTR
uniref:DUF1365 domain-containing protein n=1 Tax=Chryseobacterium sp. B5 TaxID=2050562 RepID=A0A2G7T9W3_9FLAO